MNDIEGSKKRVHTSLYNGPTSYTDHNRGVGQVETLFRELGNSFDSILTTRLEAAAQAGRSSVTVVDIGSGEGGMLRNFLTDPQVGEKSRSFLNQYPDFKLRMIGLTDSPDEAHHLTEKPLGEDESKLDDEARSINTRIDATNYYYSLTRLQTLDRFFQAQNIEFMDLALATASLRYLSPAVFEEVVKTAVGKLHPGGEFIATGFVGSHAGFAGSRNERLNVRNIPPGTSRKSMLYENNAEFPSGAINKGILSGVASQEQAAFGQAANTYKRLGVLADEEIAAEREAIKSDERYAGLTSRQELHLLANKTLSRGFTRLRERKDTERTKSKQAILESIEDVDRVYLGSNQDSPLSFVLTKK